MSFQVSCRFGGLDDSRQPRIICRKTGGLCGNVKFCEMRKRWEQTPAAARCPLLTEEEEK